MHAAMTQMLRVYRAATEFSYRVLRGIVWPKVDLGMRLWLAKIFVVSGFLKITAWQTALYLATYEYPVTWMSPVTAAYVGVTIELLGGVLLAFGLMTRYVAVPMLILSLVIQFAYLSFDSQLFWAALFGWYIIYGAGPLSVDNLLRRGLADSALPLVPRIIRASAWVRANIGPYYLSALRIYVGTALLVRAYATMAERTALAAWLPVHTMVAIPPALAAIAGIVLLVGAATRYMAGILLLGLSAHAMMSAAWAEQAYLLAVLVMFLIHGGGIVSIDAWVAVQLRRWVPELDGRPKFALDGLPRVVIVGAGFGGVACAMALRRARVAVTLIDRANHHLFQPLLYQVATAALSPGDIAAPVRPLFRDAFNTRVLLGAVSAIDTATQTVSLGEKVIPYDFLVLATGATHSYFGKSQWAPYAPGLKCIEDATEIRRRILTAFERAEATDDDREREALLTFLIVGGGPTGVELAGAIAELARFGMEKEFRTFDPATAKVVLVQSAPRLLPAFPESLARHAQIALERLGVEVALGSRVGHIDASGVEVGDKRIPARTVLWAAGVMASPAAQWLKVAADSSGRIKVGPDLTVPGLPNVYAIGDTAASNAWQGQPVPGLAPAAKQGGAYAARAILAGIKREGPRGPFVYRHRGSLATIGRKAAVADFGLVKLWGAPAWWLWGVVHVGFLVGLRNRVSTMLNWFWAYLTYGGGIRLITGSTTTSATVPLQAAIPATVATRPAA
jgi:NADH dehydrogenase/putative oxidoreductase